MNKYNANFVTDEALGVKIMKAIVDSQVLLESLTIPVDQYSRYDGLVKTVYGEEIIVEHKKRNKLYSTLMFELKKADALKIAKNDIGAKGIFYINTIVHPIWYEVFVFNITDKLLKSSQQTTILSPKTSAGNNNKIEKPVYLLDIKKAKRLVIDK